MGELLETREGGAFLAGAGYRLGTGTRVPWTRTEMEEDGRGFGLCSENMTEIEEPLWGGNTAESVVRIGATVRKPVVAATASVHHLLAHLHTVGFEGAPRPLGIDAQGRQVLEFIPGSMWLNSASRELLELRRAGTLIKALHDSLAFYKAPASAAWDSRSQPLERDILCHGDLAPWNLVCGPERWAFIDWDNATPGNRLWDLAWAAISFPPFEPACDVRNAACRLYALLSGYELANTEYGYLIKIMVARAREEYDLIVCGAAAKDRLAIKLYADGHHNYWGPVAEYLAEHAVELERLLKVEDGEVRTT